MTSTGIAERVATHRDDLLGETGPRPSPTCRLGGASVFLVGRGCERFGVEARREELWIHPHGPLDRRHTFRPVALFDHPSGIPELNPVMGRLIFGKGETTPKLYRPFSQDAHRRLRALFLPVETMPDDEWFTSAARWNNSSVIVRQLMQAAGLTWPGLSESEISTRVEFVHWPEPIEGCALDALVRHFHSRGEAILEIGSFRGRSASTMALALDAVRSSSPIISIDPHVDQPHNADHVRLSLRQVGQERRLIQILRPLDETASLLRPGSASLIFIDGDHGDAQVARDFENYHRILVPGGCMVFHDYGFGDHVGREDVCPGVRRTIERMVLPHSDYAPCLLAHTLFAFVRS